MKANRRHGYFRACLALTLVLISVTCARAQHRDRLSETDLQRLNLKGPVKEVMHIEYQTIERLADTIAMQIDDFILAPSNFRFEFNSQGYLTKKTEFKYTPREDSLKHKGIWLYEFDDLNRITRETHLRHNFSNDTTTWVYEYFGDTVTLVHKYDDMFKHMRYRYAQRGRTEYLTTANSDSSHLTRVLFVYDAQDRMIRTEDYGDQNTITHLQSWRYQDTLSKKPSLDVILSARHNYGPFVRTFQYDSLDNVVLSTGVDYDFDRRTEYTYDTYGNWTERRIFLPSKRIEIHRRTFSYY